MQRMIPLNNTAGTFLAALRRAEHRREPFDYWLLEDIFPAAVCDGIAALPFSPPDNAIFDGRREANSTKRVHFTSQMQQRFPACGEVADAFRHPRVTAAIERTTGTSLANGRLRIEYSQDADGFWLEPHVDIPVKLFTMLVYLTDAPELHDAGTDIYDASPEHKLIASAPYEWNAGLIFIPGKNTWHGFRKRPIRGLRKSIIINYVGPEWRAVEELA
jgi:hypothetical protein